MGIYKDMSIDEDDRGWTPNNGDKYVCAECIEDVALGELVTRNASSKKCTYCGSQSEKPIAAVLDIVTEYMVDCISSEYTDPAEELPWDGRDGGYLGEVYDIYELLDEIGFDVANDELREDIYSSFYCDKQWCKKDGQILSPSQKKIYGWREFKQAIKHKRRYTFWTMGDDHEEEWHPDYWPVGDMLRAIAFSAKKSGLIKQIQPETTIWRVRIHEEKEELVKDHDFAAPPIEVAIQSNRMSPAGVPMFYGAKDFETACQETVDSEKMNGKLITGGCFMTVKPLNILDLVKIPGVPSFFNREAVDLSDNLIFLHNFVRDLSKPIQRDGREHIEYVPTQAFTEYIRWEMKTNEGQPIDGVRYRSSKNGKSCYVLFCKQDECIDNPKFPVVERWLKFDPNSLIRRNDLNKK